MAVFKVQAVNPETGAEEWVHVEAFTPDMAEDEVNDQGLLVGKVRVADEVGPNEPLFEEASLAQAVEVVGPVMMDPVDESSVSGDVRPGSEPAYAVGDPVPAQSPSLPAPPTVGLVFVSAMLRVAGVFVVLFGGLSGWAVYRAMGAGDGLPLSAAWGLGSLICGFLVGLILYAMGEAVRCLVTITTDLRAIRSSRQRA